MDTQESQETSVAAAEPQGAPPTRRLVIRVKIIPDDPPLAPALPRLNKGALMLGAVAVVLSWVGFSMFRTDPTSAPAAIEAAPDSKSQPPAPVPAPSEAAPAFSGEPLPKPAAETAEARSAEAKPNAPPSPLNAVIPDVSPRAQGTIRGTIIVSVRVIVGKEGTVLVATAEDRGPSRYFERLAVEAAKQWTFTPANSPRQRIMLVRFYFTRAGTTARAT